MSKRARSSPQPIWLDCDPGHDDALAIILAGHHPELTLLGISTVSGNSPVERTTRNAAKVLMVSGLLDVPVYRGQGAPLLQSRPVESTVPITGHLHDPEIHGVCGLGGSTLLPDDEAIPPGLVREGEKAVLAMAKAILASDRPVSLVATGSLTNVALMLQLFPEVKPKLREISFMGGALGVGNRGAVAEFNILCDPEAAAIVLGSGVKLVMVPLEVTHTALITEAVLEQIGSMRSTYARMITQLLTFFKATYKRVFDFADPPLHDPCAVAWIVAPELFDTKLMRVDVECGSSLSRGQTVCDVWGYSKSPPNVHVTKAMDVPKFWEMMHAALRKANSVSSINA
jgi:inosine-uridine nucleoside N-ribohydrolase